MTKQPWEMGVGQRVGIQEDGDELLAQKKSDRDRARIARQEAEDEAAHQARMAKYNKETATSEAAVEKTGEKKEDTGGFKVRGEVNMGSIDMGEERRERKEAAERERADSKVEAERLRKEMADTTNRTADENRQLRADLHAAEIREIKAVAGGGEGSLVDQLANIKLLAAELGLKTPAPGVSDPALQVQIMELQHAEAARQREHEWDKMKHAEQMEEMREQRKGTQYLAMEKLAQQQKRDQMLGDAPKVIGSMIAKGMMESNAGDEIAEAPRGKQQYRASVPVGKAAEMDCPNCNDLIGIGTTAKMAVCAGCGSKVSIKRVESEAAVVEE